MDYSLPDSFVHGILQARILEWVAIPHPGIKPGASGLEGRFFIVQVTTEAFFFFFLTVVGYILRINSWKWDCYTEG